MSKVQSTTSCGGISSFLRLYVRSLLFLVKFAADSFMRVLNRICKVSDLQLVSAKKEGKQDKPFCRKGKDKVFLGNSAQDIEFLTVVCDVKIGDYLTTRLIGCLVDGCSVIGAGSILLCWEKSQMHLHVIHHSDPDLEDLAQNSTDIPQTRYQARGATKSIGGWLGTDVYLQGASKRRVRICQAEGRNRLHGNLEHDQLLP